MLAAGKLLALSKSLLVQASNHVIFKQSRASYIKGFWPEPLNQSTLDEFLNEINYFEEPKKFINIGMESKLASTEGQSTDVCKKDASSNREPPSASIGVDKVLDLLGEEVESPVLDLDDADLDKNQLMQLAISSGIYRDLFGHYKPECDHIKFTQGQAERLYKLVPYHWITDQPFARVERKRKEIEPLNIFEPLVRLSARFVHDQTDSAGEKYSHTSYHGNLIPAYEAAVKPSITIDGCWLYSTHRDSSHTGDSHFNNWEPGQVTYENMPKSSTSNYHSLLLLNLDSLHPQFANLHWMVANITKSGLKNEATYEEICDYLPVHGIRGFGYSRYVFLALQHESKLDTSNLRFDDFLLETRKFDTRSFLEHNRTIKMVPVGLSWFQTVWDESSNDVFHNCMKIRAPVYEYVQQKLEKRKFINMAYPGKLPFHVFMDHYRDPKEIEERVLLERLKTVDPFDYKDQYVKPRVPPTVFEEKYGYPTWMRTHWFKKKARLGLYRGLRPASAILPLNNNADLDYPVRPLASSRKNLPGFPNLYPAKPKIKRIKDLPYSKPANEHTNVYVQEGIEVYLDDVKKMMTDFQGKEE